MAKLTEAHREELRNLLARPKLGGSCRTRDGLRKTLKRLGMIRFNRPAWQWEVTEAGRLALEKQP
ncbi:hypothetical protein JYP52_01225 [Nitratireductor aquibiodomus]|uniref:hypothetical protein n=1 Tax=Nitratireductor aquibiodomus TaxID=204799 RepID=UPI0019D3BD57|nr:hypothetical protein [Nitratireductor aquibiodomus]MBN7759743.1 hypothetical protein [Nitratireductor aquibiodomus]